LDGDCTATWGGHYYHPNRPENVCPRPLLPLQAPIVTSDTNPVDTVITGMDAAAVLGMQHFCCNPHNDHPHYRGITAYFTYITADFPQYYSVPHYCAGLQWGIPQSLGPIDSSAIYRCLVLLSYSIYLLVSAFMLHISVLALFIHDM